MRFDISKGQILALSSNADVYRRGEIYFNENRVSDVTIVPEADGWPRGIFSSGNHAYNVSAHINSDYMKYTARIMVTENGVVKSYSCNCNANTVWRGACKHVVALTFHVSSPVTPQNHDRFMRVQAVDRIIKAFEKQSYIEANDDLVVELGLESDLRLEPELVINRNKKPLIRLSIGRDRMYIVKNIRELVLNIRSEATVRYGKNLQLKHSLAAFDAYSQKIIGICDRQHDSLASLRDLYNGYNPNSIIERDLPLSPHMLDEFFSINEGRAVYVSILSEDKRKILMTADAPELAFKVTEHGESLMVSAAKGAFLPLAGAEHDYLIAGDRLHRTRKGYARAATPFIDAFAASGNNEIEFYNVDKSHFYSFIYPQLIKYGLATELSTDTVFIPEKKLYFDSEGKRITCRVEFIYNGAAYNPLRDGQGRPENRIEEFKVIRMLEMLGFKDDKDRGLYTLATEERIYELYATGLDSVRKIAEVFATDAFSRQGIVSGIKTKVGVRIAGNLLRVSVDTGGYSLSELLDAVGSYNVRKKYHRLKDGRFVNLEDEGIAAATEFLSTLDASKKDVRGETLALPKFRAMYLDRLLSENTRLNAACDSEFQKLNSDLDKNKDARYEVPAVLDGVLRPYQKTGYKWMSTLADYGFGGVLADDMGLGKTLQVITLLLSAKTAGTDGEYLPSLVVTPTSLMYNWEHEIMRFAPELRAVVLSGLPAKRQELLNSSPDTDVFITTYDMLKRDIGAYDKKSFKYVIADEAQYIKNPGTQNATSVKSLKSGARFALTGTPIENTLSELWSIFDFVLPGYLHSATKFTRLYEAPIIKEDDRERAKRLQYQISPFIMRRLKREVLAELPDKVETTLYAEMYPEQRKIYLANLLKAQGVLDDTLDAGDFASSKLRILAQITRLRQISCHPALFIEDYKNGSGKLDLTIETILSATLSGHRVLLFSQFTSMLGILKESLGENGIGFFYLDGATPAELRTKMADSFNAGDKQVFLVSLKAGGTGLNLTGADVVIHYDQWWNPAVMAQATDRAHRIGQEKVVQVINIVSKDSIEEKILELQERKKNLVDSVLSEGEQFISRMTEDEIRSLFAD